MMNIILFPWAIYVSVGCWRSSEKYKGPKFWSGLVKVLVIIGVISAVCGERVSHSDALIVIILHVLILDSGLMARSIILPKNKVDISHL